MLLLTAENISKSYTEKPLLQNLTFGINSGDKIGVIGINGTGKSTLLKILAGADVPDSGKIITTSGLRIGYLPQNPVFEPGISVLNQVMLGVEQQQQDSAEYECKRILTQLGITDFEKPATELSGGQKKRAALASVLAAPSDLLILDEPTNHMDNEMVEWLQTYLARLNGALLMVTHDRYFLDAVTNKILELEDGILYSYEANYTKYLQLKAEREDMQLASERKRQTLLRKEFEWIQRGARARSTKQRFRVERYEELSTQKGPQEQEALHMSSASSRLGKKIIEIEHLHQSRDGRTLIQDFSYLLLRGDRIGIIGANGCGKSTLLKTILGVLAPEKGTVVVGETVKIGYFAQEGEGMDTNLRAIDYIKDIAGVVTVPEGTLTASQMMEKFLFTSDLQYSQIHRLSGGERRRLYLLGILMQAPNVLLLDEPTNDLDIQTLTILEDYLQGFAGAVIAVSHDRYFLDKVAEHIFAFEPNGVIRDYIGGYSDYLAQKSPDASQTPATESDKPKNAPRPKTQKLKFSFKEQREFDEIDTVIADLEEKITATEQELVEQASNYVLSLIHI